MKLLRMAAAVGAAVWLKRKYDDGAFDRARSAGSSAARHLPHPRRDADTGTHPSAASAASGAYRDDRDVAGVGVLRDQEATRR